MEFFHELPTLSDWTSGEVDGHDRASPWPSDRDREESPPPAVHL